MKPLLIILLLLGLGFFVVRFAFTDTIKQYFGFKTFVAVAVVLAAGFTFHIAIIIMLIAAMALLATASGRIDALSRGLIMAALVADVGQFISLGPLYLTFLSSVDVLNLAAITACLARQGAHRRTAISAEDLLVLLVIFCFGFAAARDGSFTGVQRTFFTIVLQFGLPYFLYRRFVNDRAEFAMLIGVLAGCAVILAGVAIAEAAVHWPLYNIIYANQSFVLASKTRGGLLRVPASFADPTAFALFEAIGIIAVIASRPYFRNRVIWFGCVGFTVLGMLAGQSRGADLGLLFGLFLMVLVRRRYALAVGVAGGSAAFIGLMLALASSSPQIAALTGTNQNTGGDQDYRQTLLRRGMEVGMQHPIFGDAMDRVITQMSDITQGEGIVDFVNTYLTMFLNSGFAGLGLFVVLAMVVFVKIFSANRKTANDSDFVSCQVFIAGALGGELLALAFTPVIYERNAYWLTLILAGCRGLRVPGTGTSKTVQRQPVRSANFSDYQKAPQLLPGRIIGSA